MIKVVFGIVSSCLLTLLVIGIILEVRAQRAERASFHAIETYPSKILDEKCEILIQLPYGYDAHPDRYYPVVYALDGGSHGQLINRTGSILQMASVSPGAIVVGISNTNRNRDLPPGYILQDDEPGNFGEGAAFLTFLEQELVPHIDQQYRTNGHRVLSGHSLAGLFAMDAFLENQTCFVVSFASALPSGAMITSSYKKPRHFWSGLIPWIISCFSAWVRRRIPK
jgi:predicted alpha/beta superfamily hydrolase